MLTDVRTKGTPASGLKAVWIPRLNYSYNCESSVVASACVDVLNYQRKQASGSGQSLQGAVTTNTGTILSQLGQVAEGINSWFTCSGKYEVPSDKPIRLVYHQPGLVSSYDWNCVEFPGVNEVTMIKLLDACSVASYGHKVKDVIDKSYRNAFKLELDNFTTNYQICSTPILQEIQSIIPTVVGIKAELYKLNIYACGGFFKAHVDTPRSEKMFGSLVVCLPTQFTGGELVYVVRHHKQEIKYDWSSAASDTSRPSEVDKNKHRRMLHAQSRYDR